MSSINLQGLINQVLSMAQASINSRGNPDYWSKPSWDQLKEENYWTEIRKRNTQLAVDKQKGEYTLRDQELANAGQLENTRETNAGELARKQLGIDFNREELEFNKRKFDSENIRDYYKTDVGAQSAKYTGSAELIKAASARANDTTLLPEQRQEAIDFLNNQYSMANKEAKQARQGLVDEQPAPAAAIPAPATPAATKPAFSLNDLTEPVGSTLVNGIAGKNPPTDFNDFKISKPAAPVKAAQPIDFTGYTPEQLTAAQKDWQGKNPDATVAGDSPAIIARQQLAKKRKEEEMAAGKAYNENLVKKNADWMSKRDERRKANAAWLGN